MINKNNVEVRPAYHLFRFSTEKRLKEFQENGYIYMKNLDFFKKLEERTMIKGQGDKYEARLFSAVDVKIYEHDSDNLIGRAKGATAHDSGYLTNPVFCCTIKNLFETIESVNESKIVSLLNFDKDLFSDFENEDDEQYVLIINDVDEFLKRFKLAANKKGFNIRYGVIIYRDTSKIYMNKGALDFNGPFHKDNYFSHQEEFRVMVDCSVEDYFEIEIGSIEDISELIPAVKLKNGIRIEGNIGAVKPIE